MREAVSVNGGKEVYTCGVCRCCGRKIKVQYQFCIGCERKRAKVYGDCVRAGMDSYSAAQRVNTVYPLMFSPGCSFYPSGKDGC